MLTVSRRKYESLVLNDNITVIVLDIQGDKVRLGIDCPHEVPIHRQELYEAVHGHGPLPPEPRPQSPEEEPFLRAIAAGPDDEATRLVYADWLEERGDPLGEFLRLQCQAKGLKQRRRALWAAHGAAWKASLPVALWAGPAGGE
jgi:carbon storage regulator